MAKGYPDFFGQQIYPTYGGMTCGYKIGLTVPPTEDGYIVEATGRGYVYGGWFTVETDAEFFNIDPIFEIDGEDLAIFPAERYFDYGAISENNSGPLSILTYDIVNGRVTIALKTGITYKISLSVGIHNGEILGGDNMGLRGVVWYGLVL